MDLPLFQSPLHSPKHLLQAFFGEVPARGTDPDSTSPLDRSEVPPECLEGAPPVPVKKSHEDWIMSAHMMMITLISKMLSAFSTAQESLFIHIHKISINFSGNIPIALYSFFITFPL